MSHNNTFKQKISHSNKADQKHRPKVLTQSKILTTEPTLCSNPALKFKQITYNLWDTLKLILYKKSIYIQPELRSALNIFALLAIDSFVRCENPNRCH